MSAIIRAHENSWRSKCPELEHTFTHAHSVKWTYDRADAEIEKMRRYLELPVHGGKENNLPPSVPPKKQLSIANFARAVAHKLSALEQQKFKLH